MIALLTTRTVSAKTFSSCLASLAQFWNPALLQLLIKRWIAWSRYRTDTRVSASIMTNAILDIAFTCAGGYALDTTVEFVCNYASSVGGAASFSGQLCTPITCATCTGTADDATKTCDRDAATDGTASCPAGCDSTAGSTTDPWCAFIQDESNRASGVDCFATPSHVWCRCLESAATLLGVSDVSLHADADWLHDGQCHPMFDTGICHRDGGDCSGEHTSSCEAQLRDVIRPACCNSAECNPVPDSVTVSCARVMVPFWERCEYEVELPYLPMWVWGGLAAYSDTKLDSRSAYCANQPTVPYSIRQRCDAHCDCGTLDPNDPSSCSDEQPSSNGDRCVYPLAPSNFCTDAIVSSDKICTCNSGSAIPFEWLCDGVSDCGMGEDETASACALTNANDLAVWGETFSATGARQSCISRWSTQVAPACSDLHNARASASSCSASCATEYLDWYMDCKHTVFGVAGSTVHATGANEFFYCCLDAKSTGSDRDCAAAPTLDSCDGDVPALNTSKLGDNVCDAALDCEAYLEDAGDCAIVVTVTLPFEVTGAFSAGSFVSALVAPYNFLQRSDVSVQRFQQTIAAELHLGCSYNGAVNAALLSSPAGRAQLVNGIASWLRVQEALVSIVAITSSNVAGYDVVNVTYTVTGALKDISEKYSASTRTADFLNFLDEANPQAIPIDMSSCGTHFISAAPAPAPDVVSAATSVRTSIVVKVEVIETEYTLARGPLAGTDSERAQSMESTIVAALHDTAAILRNLNINEAACSACIAGVTRGEVEVATFTPQGRVIAEFSESELALAVASIIVLVLGGCVCCITLCACTVYWYKRKQKRQILLIDQAGNILKEWEDEADSAEREVLMSVLHHYIEEQDKLTKAAQEREEEELIATLEAYEVIEDAIVSVPEDGGDDLLAAAKAEAQAAKKERDAKRKKAQERLAKRRAALLDTRRKGLIENGVDVPVVDAIISAEKQSQEDADQERSDLESTLDQRQIDQEARARNEFEVNMAAASTDEERAALQAAYQKDMEKAKAAMNGERSRQRAALNERLKKRKADVQAKVDSMLEGKNVASIADEDIEDEAAAEMVDDETSGQLSAAFTKDAAQLKATRDAKKAAAQAKLEERRKAMAAKHKRELMDAGAPAEVAEKQMKELDDLAQLEAKQLEQQDHVIKKKEAAALAELKAKAESEAAEADNEEVRAEMVAANLSCHFSVAMPVLQYVLWQFVGLTHGCAAVRMQAAKYRRDQEEIKKKTTQARQKQRSKLNERLSKRQQQLDKKHRAELEAVAPEAVQLAEQHSEERAALAELQQKLTATQEELAAEKAKHQAALAALAAKHDEELRMQQVRLQVVIRICVVHALALLTLLPFVSSRSTNLRL